MRVTVDREPNGHSWNGRWCGPVESEHPFSVTEEADPGVWVAGRGSAGAARDNLLLVPGYFDIALRDFGLSLAALALARLSVRFD